MIFAISPIDGRYSKTTEPLQSYFSEAALIRYRIIIEVQYLIQLAKFGLPNLVINEADQLKIEAIQQMTEADIWRVKEIEKITNHDVKAVEYFIREKLEALQLSNIKEFIHFGLTSQDINNTAIPLFLHHALTNVIFPNITSIIEKLNLKSDEYRGISMLARTHGQPASPTTVGKELAVFVERLKGQFSAFKNIQMLCKFGGATGNFNAHKVAFPDKNWPVFADAFCASLGLHRSQYTTQIAHYDDIAEFCDAMQRINTILIDLCRDIWQYISLEYFTQTIKAGEVGSSAMPHKVNPIDFENAEGNLGVANAIFHHLSQKLPISRLQRDLTDSTVLRNLGVPFAHSLIAYASLLRGLEKIQLNKDAIQRDLNANWAVLAEAIQTILRREGYDNPYDTLKGLTRGKKDISKQDLHDFIASLNVSENVKASLLALTPENYVGYY
ncbi:MAG: adenylosuccinate lyase [Saprospiraceae bacterium]